MSFYMFKLSFSSKTKFNLFFENFLIYTKVKMGSFGVSNDDVRLTVRVLGFDDSIVGATK